MENTTKRKISVVLLCVLIICVLISNFFAGTLSLFLKLQPDYHFSGDTEIHVIDIGQGDAIAIKLPSGKVMLIDTGTALFEKKLTYYLDNIVLNKDKTIDYLVLTHLDSDHSGNLLKIIERYKIGVFYRPAINASTEANPSENSTAEFDTAIAKLKSRGVKLVENKAGVNLNLDGCNFTWLSPLTLSGISDNEYSPVIRLDYNGHSAMFTGDIDATTEDSIISAYSSAYLDIDILKIAHHGSNYSTTTRFLNATTPKYACVSVGENTYGHPSNGLISRIMDYDMKNDTTLYQNLYITKSVGNIIFTLSDEITVGTISNIDDYSFISFYLYSTVAVILLLVPIVLPYIKLGIKKARFAIRNKKQEKDT